MAAYKIGTMTSIIRDFCKMQKSQMMDIIRPKNRMIRAFQMLLLFTCDQGPVLDLLLKVCFVTYGRGLSINVIFEQLFILHIF